MEFHARQVRLKDLNFNFLEGIASQLLYDDVEHLLHGNGIEANDVVAVVLLSTAPKSVAAVLSHLDFTREKLCKGAHPAMKAK